MDLPRREVCGERETALITQVRAVSGASACQSVQFKLLMCKLNEDFYEYSMSLQRWQATVTVARHPRSSTGVLVCVVL